MGSLARGQEGQFFTPPNAVQLLVELVQLQSDEVILDPACGAGGFLAASARYLMHDGVRADVFTKNLWGIDKDSYLSKLAALRIALLVGSEANIWCADSLAWRSASGEPPGINGFALADVILTNPPFGSKIIAVAPSVQSTFSLGYIWPPPRASSRFERTVCSLSSPKPQQFFFLTCFILHTSAV